MPRRLSLLAVLLIALFFHIPAACAQFIANDLDTQTRNDPFTIDRVFSGNTPYIRFYVYENGTPFTATNWNWSFKYGTNRASASMVTITPGYTISNRVDFVGDTNTFGQANDDWFCELIATEKTNTLHVTTWAQGRLLEFASPGAGSTTNLIFGATLNWNTITAFTGRWPVYSMDTTVLSVTESATGVILNVISGAGTLTGFVATNGLSGGGASGAVTAQVDYAWLVTFLASNNTALASGAISNVHIATNASIDPDKILGGAITYTTAFAGAVSGVSTSLSLAADVVVSSSVVDNSLTTDDVVIAQFDARYYNVDETPTGAVQKIGDRMTGNLTLDATTSDRYLKITNSGEDYVGFFMAEANPSNYMRMGVDGGSAVIQGLYNGSQGTLAYGRVGTNVGWVFKGSLLPGANLYLDVGATGYYWRAGYFGSLYATNGLVVTASEGGTGDRFALSGSGTLSSNWNAGGNMISNVFISGDLSSATNLVEAASNLALASNALRTSIGLLDTNAIANGLADTNNLIADGLTRTNLIYAGLVTTNLQGQVTTNLALFNVLNVSAVSKTATAAQVMSSSLSSLGVIHAKTNLVSADTNSSSAELIVNGAFSTTASWLLDGMTYNAGGVLTLPGAAGTLSYTAATPVVVGRTYLMSWGNVSTPAYDYTLYAVAVGGKTNVYATCPTGTIAELFLARTDEAPRFYVTPGTNQYILDNVSLKSVTIGTAVAADDMFVGDRLYVGGGIQTTGAITAATLTGLHTGYVARTGDTMTGPISNTAGYFGNGSGLTNITSATTAGVNAITFDGTNYIGNLTFADTAELDVLNVTNAFNWSLTTGGIASNKLSSNVWSQIATMGGGAQTGQVDAIDIGTNLAQAGTVKIGAGTNAIWNQRDGTNYIDVIAGAGGGGDAYLSAVGVSQQWTGKQVFSYSGVDGAAIEARGVGSARGLDVYSGYGNIFEAFAGGAGGDPTSSALRVDSALKVNIGTGPLVVGGTDGSTHMLDVRGKAIVDGIVFRGDNTTQTTASAGGSADLSNLSNGLANTLSLNGGTVTGAVYSTATSASSGPVTNEFATAGWVRGLLAVGTKMWFSTNPAGVAWLPTNTTVFALGENTDANVLVNNTITGVNHYVASMITTQRIVGQIDGPISVAAYAWTPSGANRSLSMKPELYFTYDVNDAALTNGDWDAAAQVITTGSSNLYEWIITMPTTTFTGQGAYVVGRMKIVSKGSSTTNVSFGAGGSQASHMQIIIPAPTVSGSGATQAISTVGSSTVTSSYSGGTLSWSNAAATSSGSSAGTVTNMLFGGSADFWLGTPPLTKVSLTTNGYSLNYLSFDSTVAETTQPETIFFSADAGTNAFANFSGYIHTGETGTLRYIVGIGDMDGQSAITPITSAPFAVSATTATNWFNHNYAFELSGGSTRTRRFYWAVLATTITSDVRIADATFGVHQ